MMRPTRSVQGLLTYVVSALFISAAALGQTVVVTPATGPTLSGTTSTVNNGPGDQSDPHVATDWVAYTSELNGGSEIRIHNLATGADSSVPNVNGGMDFLSDIAGTTVAYTHLSSSGSGVFTYDVTGTGSPQELAAQSGSNRRSPAIGNHTVVWQDFGFNASLLEPEVVAFDTLSHVTTRLSTDDLLDKDPGVSPDGNVIVWTKCQTNGTGCVIWRAQLANGGWTSQALTGTEGEASLPDTDGNVVVYGSTRSVTGGGTTSAIYWQPVAGGPEQQLAFAGGSANPNVSGKVIAFEHRDPTAANPNWDVYVYDLTTNTLYRLTDTAVDETLNDIYVGADGLVRVAWTAGEADYNVYAFSFRLAAAGCSNGKATSTCADPSGRPLLATLSVKRTNRKHGDDRDCDKDERQELRFDATAGDGLMCVDNGMGGAPATRSGEIHLNGHEVMGPSLFKRATATLEKHVTLRTHNELVAEIEGRNGTGYRTRVYGPNPACPVSASTRPGDLRLKGNDRDLAEVLHGVQTAVVDGTVHLAAENPEVTVAHGCDAGGALPAVGALVAVAAFLLSSRRPRPIPAPMKKR